MKFFTLFLGKQLKIYLFFLLAPIGFTAIFTGIFYLYRIPTEASLFAGMIYFLITLIGVSIHCILSWKKYSLINQYLFLPYGEIHDLPKAESAVEENYQNLIESLIKQLRQADTRWATYHQESMDYYTTWVHQIKAPIAAMRLILQGEDTSEHHELENELFRIEQYVEMVLGYVRLDSSSSDLVLHRFPLDNLIRTVIRHFAPLFIRKRLHLVYTGTDEIVLSDEKWLSFILEQLLSNAIKYTPKGSITITVQGQCLSISDTGIGIAPEDLPRIFEKGFTGYNGRGDQKATGIGLYLCRETAKRLGHRLSAASALQQGSVFTLDMTPINLTIE